MLQLNLNIEMETRLTQMAQNNGYNVKEWVVYLLNGLLERKEWLEELEDVIIADRIKKAIDNGEEETFSLLEVEQRLGLKT